MTTSWKPSTSSPASPASPATAPSTPSRASRGAIEATEGVNDDVEMAEHLLSEAGVALVPGSAFGTPDTCA